MNGKVTADRKLLIQFLRYQFQEPSCLNVCMNDLDTENKNALMQLKGKRQGSITNKDEDQNILQKGQVVLGQAYNKKYVTQQYAEFQGVRQYFQGHAFKDREQFLL